MAETTTPHPIRPHRLGVKFTEPLQQNWFAGNRTETQLMNALGLIFPLGERFFVRSCREILPKLTDPTLIAQTKGFCAQEMHHAFQHERSFELLARHGVDIKPKAESLEAFTQGKVEGRIPLSLRLSLTAAFEQFTASFAEYAFRSGILDDSEPEMRELFLWHAAEELEHKSVAFDVFTAADGRYWVRALGMVLAWPIFVGVWYAAAIRLLADDVPKRPLQVLKEWTVSALKGRLGLRELFGSAVIYFRPSYHPSQDDNLHYAVDFFAKRDADGGLRETSNPVSLAG